ncbi:MAG: nitroreductase family protein [Deltaproteobacteria bacterium]|nr:nitroreductase family protein [Deltaproteobacteria bacterium]
MELTEAIKGRRSVRKFKPQPVPKAIIEKILDLARWAPSGMNRQEWYFVVVQGEKKAALLQLLSAAFAVARPELEKVFAGKPKIIEGVKEFFRTYGGAPVIILAYAGKTPAGQWDTHSTALAVQNLLLAAYAEGLGTVWTDGFMAKEEEINALLGVEGKKLIAAIPLGYPDETPRVPPRREGQVQWAGF